MSWACSAAAPAGKAPRASCRLRSGSGCRGRRAWWPDATSGASGWSGWPPSSTAGRATSRSQAPIRSTRRAPRGAARPSSGCSRRAQRVRDLAAIVVGLIDDITEAGAAPEPWSTRVRWLRRLGSRLIGDDRPGVVSIGRPTSSGRPIGSRLRSSDWPPSTASTIPRPSRCSAARWSWSSMPTWAASDGSARGCWSGRCRSRWVSISTWSSSSGWPRARCRRPSTTTRCFPTASGASPGVSCPCDANAWGASSGASWRRWPQPTATCCAHRAATCGRAANGSRRAGWSSCRRGHPHTAAGPSTCRRSPMP